MRKLAFIGTAALALAGCRADTSGGNGAGNVRAETGNAATGDEQPGTTTIRIDRSGARIDSDGSDIRIDSNGIELELDRDVEVNLGDVRARVRSGEDGSLTVTTNRQ